MIPLATTSSAEESSVRLILGDATAEMARVVRQAGTDVRVFAPYLTSDVATNILADADRSSARVYTLFDARLFAQGSSSLDVLRSLLEAGFAVYHLPNLHAKIVLAGDSALSVGSQNLTERGMQAREATIVTTDPGAISAARVGVTDWERERVPISLAMVDDLGARLPRLREEYSQFVRSTAEVEELVTMNERDRQTSALKRMKEGLERVAHSREEYLCTVRELNGPDGHYYYSLSPDDKNVDLTRWMVAGGIRKLDPYQRYACLCLPGGWLGWARLAKTRITRIAADVSMGPEQFGGLSCRIALQAQWESSLTNGSLVCEFRPPTTSAGMRSIAALAMRVNALFTIDGVEILNTTASATPSDENAGWYTEMRTKTIGREGEFRAWLLRHITNSFKYSDKLRGFEATAFFGSLGSRHCLRLVSVDGCSVLVAEKL